MNDRDKQDLKDMLPKTERSESFFGKGGNLTDESSFFAKILTVNERDYYFLWFKNGSLFDPYGNLILKRSGVGAGTNDKLVKVSKKVYDLYFTYLKTKNQRYLLEANRAQINRDGR